jgi:hypothetical protein
MRFSRSRDRGAALLLVGVLVLGTGCVETPSGTQVRDEIHAKFKQDSGLQDKSITVQIAGGVVTLSGSVDNDAERTAAARYASMTPGIKEVVNDLQIVAAAPTGKVALNAEAAPAAPAPSAPEAKARPSASSRSEEKPARDDSSHHQSSDSSSTSFPKASDSSSANANADPSPEERQIADTSSVSSQKAEATPDAPSAPELSDAPATPSSDSSSDTKLMTIEAGTTMAIRLVDEIDSEIAQSGQTFRATLDSPLSVEWDVAIPAGYNVEGHVAEVKSAGKFAGQSELVLTLDKILVRDKSYDIQTDEYRRKGKNQSTNTAAKVGVGAALGAVIGGIAGGGKGAGIGAAAGGGLGGASQAAGKGAPVRISSETVLHFTLQSPVTVTQVEQGPEQERRKMHRTN